MGKGDLMINKFVNSKPQLTPSSIDSHNFNNFVDCPINKVATNIQGAPKVISRSTKIKTQVSQNISRTSMRSP